MKPFLTPFMFLLIVIMTNCSPEQRIENDLDFEAEIEKRNDINCVNSTPCTEPNYVFPTCQPLNCQCFSINYDESLTLEEIYCIRYAYFKCYPDLKLNVFQSTADPYLESWCLPIGKSGITLSSTIDTDPRVDDGD